MADNFSEEEIKEFKEVFSAYDKAGKGTITSQDLVIVIKKLGLNPTDAEFNDMINDIISERGGKIIDFPVFVGMMARMLQNVSDEEAEVQQAFRAFDKDEEGYIPAEELKFVISTINSVKGVTNIPDKEVDELVKKADADGDGRISYEEFKAIMLSK